MNIKPLGQAPSQSKSLFQNSPSSTSEPTIDTATSTVVSATNSSVSLFQWASLLRGVWVTFKFFWFVCFSLPWKIIQAGRPSPEQKRQSDNFFHQQRRDEWSRNDKEYWNRHK